MTPALPPAIQTLLITGAAGTLGKVLAPPLRALCQRLVLSDLPGPLSAIDAPGKVTCDLADAAAVRDLLQGVQAVVHLGGVAVEGPFGPIVEANLRGLLHLYEAARVAGTKRIVFASSNHVTGCRGVDERISPTDPPRPDGFYGVSKLFGEGVASLYHDRFGIESVCLRIGTALPEPIDRRSLSTWLSWPDLVRLVSASLITPGVGFTVAYGMSRNARGWWDTAAAWQRIGYEPQDDAEAFAAKVESVTFPPGTPMALMQGGSFLGIGPFPFPPDDHKET